MTQQWKIGAIILIVIVVAGLGVAAQRMHLLPLAVGTASNATTTSSEGNAASSTAPSLTGNVQMSADLSPEVQSILTADITRLRATLSKNYEDYSSWLNLAIKYKMAGDYKGAEAIWKYLAFLHPDDATSRHNLGDLYQSVYKNYPTAEQYFKQAVDVAPTLAINYLSLFDLYRYNFKQQTTAAVDILKLGISRVSGSSLINMYAALASYYEGKGDAADAITYYAKARDAAKAAGNTQLAAQYEAAIASLNK